MTDNSSIVLLVLVGFRRIGVLRRVPAPQEIRVHQGEVHARDVRRIPRHNRAASPLRGIQSLGGLQSAHSLLLIYHPSGTPTRSTADHTTGPRLVAYRSTTSAEYGIRVTVSIGTSCSGGGGIRSGLKDILNTWTLQRRRRSGAGLAALRRRMAVGGRGEGVSVRYRWLEGRRSKGSSGGSSWVGRSHD